MPAGRKVSGAMFTAINTMPMNPAFSVPYLAHASIKGNATCPKAECEDSVGKLISGNDVKALHGAKKAVAVEAEGVLQRAADLVSKLPKDCTVEFGNFQVKILLKVLGRSSTADAGSLRDMANTFLTQLTGKRLQLVQIHLLRPLRVLLVML